MARKLSAKLFISFLEMMKPVFIPLFWVGGKIYKLTFGRVDLRMSKEAEEKFGHEILASLPFLFDSFRGRLCADTTVKHPRPFDCAIAIVALDEFSLRFIRGRGEFRVQIAVEQDPIVWEDLTTILGILDESFQKRDFSSFKEVEAALRPRMKHLKEAFLVATVQTQLSSRAPHRSPLPGKSGRIYFVASANTVSTLAVSNT
jgi:hypothetical protein